MTPEDRKQVAKDLYQDLVLNGMKPEIARQHLQDQHGLTQEQLDEISPRPKSSAPKPQPPTRASLETELQTCAGLLRSVGAALNSRTKGPQDYRHLARNVEKRATKIEQLLNYNKEKPRA